MNQSNRRSEFRARLATAVMLCRLAVVVITSTLVPTASAQPATADAPTWRATGVLLIDQVPKSLAFGLAGREEAAAKHAFEWKVGNWDPHTRITGHASLPLSRVPWRLTTGIHDWQLSADHLQQFRHHVFIIDRPVYHQPEGRKKERALHVALSTDVVTTGGKIQVQWRWDTGKGLEPLNGPRLSAFAQQAPTAADDVAGWSPVALETERDQHAVLRLPPSLKPGNAWLRIGLTEGTARPTDRLLAEIRLWVKDDNRPTAQPQAEQRTMQIGGPPQKTRVPDPWRQGEFLHPQSVSALDISDDGHFVGVTTM